MYSLLEFLFHCLAICSAAALPRIQENSLRQRSRPVNDAVSFNAELRPRTVPDSCLVVPLTLRDSGYCGNISIGSQEQSIVALFDLNTSRLSALSSNVQYCHDSEQCSALTCLFDSYDPRLSDTAVNSTVSFELSISTSVHSGVVYEDSVSIGGNSSQSNILTLV